MSQLTVMVCDGCSVTATEEAAKRFWHVAVGAVQADICSIECAQVWVARQFELFAVSVPERAIPSCSYVLGPRL